jgi:hypothetical protein
MFLRQSRNSILMIFALSFVCLWPCIAGGKSATEHQHSRLRLDGRIIASVITFVPGTLNLKWQVFVFQVESGEAGGHGYLSKVEYEYTDADGPLKDAFFDYAKYYQLIVSRDSSCDESLESLSILRAPDEHKSVFRDRNLLQVLAGVPTEALDMHETLPCFILRPGGYRILKRR